MKRLIALTVMFALTVPSALAQSETQAAKQGFFEDDQVQMVMTFNLSSSSSDENSWEKRQKVTLELLQEYRPVFIGTQEGLHERLEYLEQRLEDYRYLGISRQGNTEDEYSAIFYDTTQAEVRDSGTYWLSNTPQEPGSMMENTGHPRIVTWGEFVMRGNANPIYVFNTHLAFEEGVTEKQVAVLLEQLGEIVQPGAEVLVTGDFNVPRRTHVWNMFQEAGFKDAWQLATYTDGPNTTFHDWEGSEAQGDFEQGVVADEGDYQIDWILYRGAGEGETAVADPLLAQVVTFSTVNATGRPGQARNGEGARYPSDHYPVVLTTLGNPDVEANDLQVQPTEVDANQPLTASARLVNNGERGLAEILLYIDREVTDSQWVVLDASERRSTPLGVRARPVTEQQLTFDIRLYDPGEHVVSIALLPAATVNVEGAPATLNYDGLTVEPYVLPGQAVPVTATITNTGSFEGTMQSNFFVGNTLMDSTLLAVPSGGAREVGFVHTFHQAGTYGVAIGNQVAEVSVMRDLSGKWNFKRGDAMAWTKPDFDDSGWETVELPAAWEEHSDYTEANVYGWYRKTIKIPAPWKGQSVRLILGQIDDTDMSYFNGEKIGQTGGFPGDEGGFETQWDVIREYVVPPELIRYGEENVIAIRVFDELGGGGLHSGPLGFLPLETTDE